MAATAAATSALPASAKGASAPRALVALPPGSAAAGGCVEAYKRLKKAFENAGREP